MHLQGGRLATRHRVVLEICSEWLGVGYKLVEGSVFLSRSSVDRGSTAVDGHFRPITKRASCPEPIIAVYTCLYASTQNDRWTLVL